MGMLIWTWGTWPDVLVDFGDQRYIPWRLAEGDVLYRDIAFYNGPFSQYFHALCFSMFGASLRTLVLCNLVLLALLLGLICHALRQVSHRLAATVACIVFVLLFAFAQFTPTGNYNYVCPYSYEVTHGLLLSLLAVVAAWPSQKRGLLPLAVSGLALGLAFLTKAEVFLAGFVATTIALLLGTWVDCPCWRQRVARLIGFLVALLVPPIIAFSCLAAAMPARQALLGTLGSWVVVARPDVLDLPFFRAGTGMDRPLENVLGMVSTTAFYALILVPAGLLGLGLRQKGKRPVCVTVIASVVFGAVAGMLWCWRAHVDWLGIARPFPLLLSGAGVAIVAGVLSSRHGAGAERQFIRRISLLTFAMVLLAKMMLNARIYHYGFVLAMPAMLVLTVAALDWVPAFIDQRGGDGRVFIAAVLALLLVTGANYLTIQAHWIDVKQEQVGVAADGFMADRRGGFVNTMMAEIANRSSPDTTLAVLPEGAMFNSLAGLRNSTPFIHLMPVEVMLFGEERIAEAFRVHPPDLIVLAHKDTTEFGFPFFGSDYAPRLGAWIRANYRSVSLIGSPPLQDQRDGLLLLERNGRLR